jgi:hypothetical protein
LIDRSYVAALSKRQAHERFFFGMADAIRRHGTSYVARSTNENAFAMVKVIA